METRRLAKLLPYVAFGLVVLVAGLWGIVRGGSDEGAGEVVVVQPGSSSGDTSAGGAATETTHGTSTTGVIYVQVAGEVRRPGVVPVPPGTRVFEVLRQVGGVTEEGDEQALPLAEVLQDGSRIYVPPRGAGTVGGAAGGVQSGTLVSPNPSASPGSQVSLSRASAAELEELPGIGPAMAARILAHREENGPFLSVDELDDVPGIGPATLERLRPLVSP